jgi:hypothetical protein
VGNIESWAALLIQVPLVGVFIWYSLVMNERMVRTQTAFMAALDRRDEEFEKRNLAVISAIERMNAATCAEIGRLVAAQNEHDRWVRDNIARRKAV